MIGQLWRQSIAKGMKLVFMFLGMGAVLFALGFHDLQDIRKGTVKFEDLKPGDLSEGTFVELSITENYGSFMEQNEQKAGSSVQTTTKVCYFIGMGQPGDADFRLVSLVVPATDEKRMENMAENTFNGKSSSPMSYICEVKEMGSQARSYANTYLNQAGLNSAEINDMLLTYHLIECDWEAKTKFVYIMCGSGAVLAAIGILVLLYSVSGLSIRKIKKEIKKTGYSQELVEADYRNAKVLMDHPAFRIGKVFTFFYTGATPHAILNKNIIWGYYHVVVEKGKYGLLKKTSHMVVINTLDKRSYTVDVPAEGKAQYILRMLNMAMPWMIIGSDDAFFRMYNKDFQGFLNLHYNKINDKTTNNLPNL